jgi:benzoyl-CoA reductase/2-hydroxyglutaryl-CoA dehydratase subunit BcrC/BadD/HgdB
MAQSQNRSGTQRTIHNIISRSAISDALEPFASALTRIYSDDLPKEYALVFCLQTFDEIFMAAGLPTFRLCSGDREIGNTVQKNLPVLCCPVVRSSLGFLETRRELFEKAKLILLPTTCDWKVKMADFLSDFSTLHILELPHCHGREKSQRRWESEVRALVDKIEGCGRGKIQLSSLLKAIKKIRDTQTIAEQLDALRQSGRISHNEYLLVSGAYFMMDPDQWSGAAAGVLEAAQGRSADTVPKVRIFLAGAPCIFPNFKIPEVIEACGAVVVGDESCSASRQFWDITPIDETNRENLLASIANRYYQSCICPNFTPNVDRTSRIVQKMAASNSQGVIYHVLKGCHLYDFERFKAESFFRGNKIPFLHIETDDGLEDINSIQTRIEAFVESIRGRKIKWE